MIELHADQTVKQIFDDHVVTTVRIGRWRRQKICGLCQRPDPCPARQRATDIRAGRRDIAGRPL